MMNGIINVYKEAGFTSHDVVAKLRGILKMKKIGHTGTLDPDATGVLPICLGKATKVCELLTDKDKTYEAVLLLGTTTDTQDTSGEVLTTSEVTSTREEVEEAILSFVGDYDQIPPMYSALKVNGKKLYELAREGKEVERKARRVRINHITITSIDLEKKEVVMTVSCSKGTYIRTLCYDIGEKLGCGGCMKQLTRTKVSQFELSESLTLSEIESYRDQGTLLEHIMPIEDMFPEYTRVVIKEEFCRFIYNGNPFKEDYIEKKNSEITTPQVCVYDSHGEFVGIYKKESNTTYKPVKMFL